jgi:hypothetical protein
MAVSAAAPTASTCDCGGMTFVVIEEIGTDTGHT